jgi:NADH:ubiquinone oxidoreductase subunit
MTIGTRLYTLLHGIYVGKDEFGNRYYRGKHSEGNCIGRADKERRWVLYNGAAEPSRVPPIWHEWLHYISDAAPTEADAQKSHKWMKDHVPNLTGTYAAYRPNGHIYKGGKRDKATGDYEPWNPK